ncbi:hypothetical protein R5H32_18120 [Defluviimonas sp. D31]|uniref:hypothetical protein n=1 Tax=Defluviimonas sp. D31 TaxID=3083253 RepID=UPI00296E75B5|nr:hypothetical protein [Defluviimonas sp. D31]MDW4551277.1 hypothetical protein [Defluviimonas sp. D31]
MKNVSAGLLALLMLSACAKDAPAVSDYNGDSVKVVTPTRGSDEETKVAAQKEADRVCSIGNRKRAEYASTRELPDNQSEHLFLCL